MSILSINAMIFGGFIATIPVIGLIALTSWPLTNMYTVVISMTTTGKIEETGNILKK